MSSSKALGGICLHRLGAYTEKYRICKADSMKTAEKQQGVYKNTKEIVPRRG